MTYLYPQNLKAAANLWLWSLRDFTILCLTALLSVAALVQLRVLLPAALTMCYAFLSIRMEERTILNFLNDAARYFLTTQQYFIWR